MLTSDTLTTHESAPTVPVMTADPRHRATPLGDALRAYRKEHDISQAELARRMEHARSHVAGWEAGRGISAENRTKVAKFLGVKPEALGKAWNPRAERQSYWEKLKSRQADAEAQRTRTLGDNPERLGLESRSPQFAERSVDMAGCPDPELLDRFLGLWRALPTTEARQNVFDAAVRELQGGSRTAIPKAAR